MESALSCVLLLLCGLWSSVCPVPLAINKTVGHNVTLVPRYIGDPSEINWKMNGNKLVDMELRPQEDPVFYRLQGRATINHTDGVLTIRDLTKGDSGVYRAEVLLNNVYQVTEINLMVLDDSVPPTFTSSTGPPNIHVTSATKGPSFNSSPGPPETKKTKSHTEGPSSRSTTHSTKVKPSGMSDSTRQVILVVVGLVVMGVFVGCLLWCFCCGKERKQTYNTKDPYTAGLLGAGKSEETEAGNDVKSGVKESSLDTSGTETEVGNDVQPEEKRSSLDAPGTETEVGNDVQPEEKRSSLDAPGTETEVGNDVHPEEKRSSLDAPGTETEVGNDVQPEEKRSSLDAPGTETEVEENVQPEEDEPVTVL